jgi:hypothetical protein
MLGPSAKVLPWALSWESVKVLPWALSWGECEGIANDTLLQGKQPRCKVTVLSIADLEDAPRQRAASEEHLSLVTPLIPGVRTQSMTSSCRNMLTKRKHAGSTKHCHLVGQALSLFSPSRYHYCVCVIHMMYHYLLVCQISWIYIVHMPWFLYDTKVL